MRQRWSNPSRSVGRGGDSHARADAAEGLSRRSGRGPAQSTRKECGGAGESKSIGGPGTRSGANSPANADEE